MPRTAKPWFRKSDGWWYLNLRKDGQVNQVRLAEGRKAKDAAMQRYHELMAERAAEKRNRPAILPPSSGESAWAIIDRFLTHAKTNVERRTFDSYKFFLDQFAVHVGPDLLVKSLKVHHVTEWLDSQTTWGTSTKNGAVGAVRRAFRWATEQGIIPSYPLFGMKAPRKLVREVTLTESEFNRLISKIRDHQFRDLLQFAWNTGCRPQESARVDVEHFQREHRRLVIPASKAKGKKAPRVIYLNEAAFEIAERAAGDRKSGPLFRNLRGERWTRNAVKCRFARLEPKVGARYCAYHLRHSWGTAGLEKGVDPITLSVLMGHSDPSQLARTYQHLAKNPKHLIDAAGKVR